MAWRVARSLDKLLAQLNALAPRRSKVSDGSIGDAAHASRDSDHNPWYKLGGHPLVTARDYTHDPDGGLDCHALAAALVRSRDTRIKYIIWDRRICSGAGTPSAWMWRAYKGANPHTKHLHLSVVATPACDDTREWSIGQRRRPTISYGNTGPDVELVQRFLGVVGPGQPGYGSFGKLTENAVIKYQRMKRLTADGIVGPATWAAMGL